MTQNLVDLAQWIQANGVTAIIVAVTLVFLLYVILRWPTSRMLVDTWILRVPIIGSVFRLAGTATLASSLAVMIRSGTKLVNALSLAESLQTNRYLAAQVASACEAIKRGEGLSRTLASGHGYNPMLISMLEVAERTGHLDASLEDVAEYCEVELRKKVKRLSAMVEPAIILVAGGIVGYVYMAFFMALMSSGGSIR
jgi:type IV pilus assembly protein PilC